MKRSNYDGVAIRTPLPIHPGVHSVRSPTGMGPGLTNEGQGLKLLIWVDYTRVQSA